MVLPDHPSPAICNRIQRWIEIATWAEQWNPALRRWEKSHWLDLRNDFPDVSYMYIDSHEHGPLPS
jgi:hypothetical protein